MADLRLNVNGISYGGWKSIRVHRGIEEMAGTFDLSVSELWAEQTTPREIATNDAASIVVGGRTLITGFVDAVSVSYDASSHETTVRGRDAAGDLCDSSAIYKTGRWRNATILQIARDLCAPFRVTVRADVDVGGPFKEWAVQEGETVHDCIERAARHRGLLLISDGMGGIVLTRPTTKPAVVTLELGVNIRSASTENRADQRFSQYVVKGQTSGDDSSSGEAVSAQKVSIGDPGMGRYRPLVIVAEDQADIATLKKRAEFERTVRAARGLRCSVFVQGWSTPEGGLWSPNTRVRLVDPFSRVKRELLIAEVDLVLDEQGERTELLLTIPEAYNVLAEPEPTKKGALL